MCGIFKALLTCASVVVGLLLMVASSLAIVEYKDTITKCFRNDDSIWNLPPDQSQKIMCDSYFAMTGCIAAGILAALIQIFGCLSAFVNKSHAMRSWRSFHATVFFLTVVSFGVGLYYFGSAKETLSAVQNFQDYQSQDKKTLLNAAHGLDWIFCLIMIILASCLPEDHLYDRP